jgi:oligopeptide transport system ATP-binding protein
MTTPLIVADNLVKEFHLPGGWLSGKRHSLRAVDGVSFTVMPGEVFGLVGESGCGKSTLGLMLLRLLDITSGNLTFDNVDLTKVSGEALRQLRQQMQIVFQNPVSSLSPRLKVFDIVAEPLRTHQVVRKTQMRDQVLSLLKQVGLGENHLDRFPHEISGGQCQRVAIARALALRPRVIVLDEPTSALDVSVQAQIINLLVDLQKRLGLTFLFISHDLNVVQHISDRIGVMYLGKLVEIGKSEAIFADPLHPYTQALLASIPQPEVGNGKELVTLQGTVPSAANPPPGCRFHTRCPKAISECKQIEPKLVPISESRFVACHLVVK